MFNDADSWLTLGGDPGFNDSVRAMIVDEFGTLYCGGDFTSVDSIEANRVAVWDGISWYSLGFGMNNDVTCLAGNESELYAGGRFTKADDKSAFGIAMWDGLEWNALGSGMNGPVYAVAIVGTDVYAGGMFTKAGGVTVNNIAKWDGESWSALSNGTNGTVYALHADGTGVYVGGDFTLASGALTNYVARWSGTEWETLGSGVNQRVGAFASSGSDLYVGGEFTRAGGINIGRGVARWNATGWSALGSGVNSSVLSLSANDEGDVYAGGVFSGKVAQWNGSTWSGLGSGTNSNVRALADYRFNLFVGGDFTTAGDKNTPYAAEAIVTFEANLVVEYPAGTRVRDDDTIDFGKVAIDSTDGLRTITLRNLGNVVLTIDGAELTSEEDIDHFTLNAGDIFDPLAPEGSSTFSVSFLPTEAGEKTATLTLESNDPDDSPFALNLKATGATADEIYADAVDEAELMRGDAAPNAIPYDDGVENILKYAFNMDLGGPDSSTLAADGDSGLPRYSVVEDSGGYFFRFEFIRRKGSGLIYTPLKSAVLDSDEFTDLSGTEVITDINPLWERVIIDEPVDLATNSVGFGRLMVELPTEE